MSRAAVRCLDRAPPGWEALLSADPDATPAHRPEVWAALCETLGMSLTFVAVESQGALLGGAAALIERRAGLAWIHALPFLLSGAPLARTEARSQVDLAVGEMLGRLQVGLGAIGGEWVLYRPAEAALESRALDPVAGESRMLDTMLIDLTAGLDSARRRLDRETRHELRLAGARGLRFAEEAQALEEAYALHLAQARGWGNFRPLPIELSRRLLSASGPGECPPARLFTVRDGHGLVSAMLALDHPRETFAWWSGTRPSGRARHAGLFLLWSATEWASERGRDRMNLGGSAGRLSLAAFKRSLGARRVRFPVRWLDSRSAPWPGRALARLQRRLRRGRFRGESM